MRIVAGVHGGRRLVAPKGSATRPTGERVREALYAVLGAELVGARVLDVYAGTGALGLEALSRGAEHVVFVESASAAQQAIRANVATLGVEAQTTLIASPAERALARIVALGPFGLTLADPPWAHVDEAAALLATLAKRGAIAVDGAVVLEHPREASPLVEGLSLRWRRDYGDTGLSIFERPSADG